MLSLLLVSLCFASPLLYRSPVRSKCIATTSPSTSTEAAPAINVKFLNDMNVTIDICWSNFAGKLIRISKVRPFRVADIDTFEGHIWNFREPSAGKRCTGAPLSDPMMINKEGYHIISQLLSSCPTTVIEQEPLPIIEAQVFGIHDYRKLEKSLRRKFVNADNIPKIVRLSFHDLANFDPATNAFGGPSGCIFNETVMSFAENNGLRPIAAQLTQFVELNFPNTNFPMGDVISLAGKVAVEMAYPGTVVKWRFGRAACNHDAVAGIETAPPSNIDSMAKMQPFLDRYSLSANEMAILTTGAHAIAKSSNFAADTGIFDFTLSTFTSGLQFIKDSQDLLKVEIFFGDWYGTFSTNPVFGRFPSDMLFFPSTVSKVPGAQNFSDPSALPVEAFLNSFTAEVDFNTQFATVFSKMLEIGVANDLTAFN